MLIGLVLKRLNSLFYKTVKEACNDMKPIIDLINEEEPRRDIKVVDCVTGVFLHKRKTGHLYYGTDLEEYLSTDDCGTCDGVRCKGCQIEFNILKCGSHFTLYQGFDKNKAIEIWKENDLFTGRTRLKYFDPDFASMPCDFDPRKNALVIIN